MHDRLSTETATSGGKHLRKSPVVKRSIVIGGHKTSVSLEDAFWDDLRAIAHGDHATLSDLVGNIDKQRSHDRGNLSSAIRVFVLEYWRRQQRAA